MKLKTHQATAKKIKLSHPKKGKKTKKLLMKKSGQDHFNARETGKTTRNKRRIISTPKTLKKTVKNYLPYL